MAVPFSLAGSNRYLRHSMNFTLNPTVIPAKAGIHGECEAWIPAFAGMTPRQAWGMQNQPHIQLKI
jgi:hypothetical protein